MKQLYLLCILLSFEATYAQYNDVLDFLYERKIEVADQLINSKFEKQDQQLLQARLAAEKKDLATSFQILFEMDTLQLNTYQKSFYYDFLARAYDSNSERDEAITHFYQAQKLFKKQGLLEFYNQINLDIYYLYISSEALAEKAPPLLEEFYDLAKKLNHPQQLVQAHIDLAFNSLEQQDLEEFNRLFKEGFEIAEKNKDAIGIGKLHSYKGLVYGEILGDFDTAEFHYNRAIEIYDSIQDGYKKKPLLLNKSNLYANQGNYEEAIRYLLEADQQSTSEADDEISLLIYKQLSEAYENTGKIDSALVYNKKTIAQIDAINEAQQNINITRFEAEKKENENILLQQKNERNRNLLILLGVILLALIMVIYLIYANAKRKQLLLSKKRELAEQRNQSLLKEQELKSIDAMLAGQEKERQRMASDLHDNIGASLTSLKMHFNHIEHQIKNKKFDEELFQRTEVLLNETYEEIRNLAHVKNAGVLAKDGLVPALEKLVEKSSNTTNFKVDLHIHDVDKRLSSNLEIGIFRIIQELITNIIKHAKASKASIAITNHGDLINIIVEDNGIGFDSTKVKKNGMGLQSIQKRVAHLNGEIEIESTTNKGTTIIIDLPL